MGGNRLDGALPKGRLRLDLVGTGAIASLDHVEACPDADPPLCATDPFPPHLHDQSLYWARATLTGAAGLGRGWQLQGSVGLDLKVTTIAYTTLDGAPYDPPYGDLHHRNETLFGLADGAMGARKDLRAGALRVGVSGGTTLPFGRTEADPFALTAEGKPHQHFQRGTGVFTPTAALDVAAGTGPVTATAWLDGRAPPYANGEGYRPGPSAAVGIGPVWAPVRGLRLVPALEASAAGVDHWSAAVAPGSGTLAIGGSLTALGTLSTAVRVLGVARTTAWQRFLQEEGDQVTQRLVLSAGVSVAPPPR